MSWLSRRRDARLERLVEPRLRALVNDAMVTAGQWRTPNGADYASGFMCQACGLPLFTYDASANITTCKNGHRWTDQAEAQGFAA